MVLLLEGNSEHLVHVLYFFWLKCCIGIYFELSGIPLENFKFALLRRHSNFLNQVKLPSYLYTCAPISELPSNKSIMTKNL